MKPPIKPKRTAEQRAEEEAIRRQHATNPIRERPAGVINRQSFAATLRLVARLEAAAGAGHPVLSPDGARLFVVNHSAPRLHVFDAPDETAADAVGKVKDQLNQILASQ